MGKLTGYLHRVTTPFPFPFFCAHKTECLQNDMLECQS